jgi:hypothetical protein
VPSAIFLGVLWVTVERHTLYFTNYGARWPYHFPVATPALILP